MQVSFIVPLFNCLPYTQAMVASLRSSLPDGLSHEIILVDDGSTDGTRKWLETVEPPHRVLLNDRNLGYAAANNRGAAAARGAYLGLLNNDLVLARGWLEPMLEAHRRLGTRAGLIGNVQLDAATGRVDHAGIFVNHKGKPDHLRSGAGPLARLLAPVKPVGAVTGACVLVSRAFWEELGGFDEGYRNGCEDIDFCLRAAAAGRMNAVALGSRVLHHVSRAPGRKASDEANTYRLALRWRDALAPLGLRDWCRHHFETFLPEPRDFPDPSLASQVFWYLLRLRRRPPDGSMDGMRAAIAVEIDRWRRMFGDPAS